METNSDREIASGNFSLLKLLRDYQGKEIKGLLSIEKVHSYKKVYAKKILHVDIHGVSYETADGQKGFLRLGMIGGIEEVPE